MRAAAPASVLLVAAALALPAVGAPATLLPLLRHEGFTVVVVDSGIDASHPEFEGRVLLNLQVVRGRLVEAAGDASGHGTHVAGLVGGRSTGVSPDVSLIGIDVRSDFTARGVEAAFEWVLEQREALGIRIVVNPWGRPADVGATEYDRVLAAIGRLADAGVLVVFAAGNEGPAPDSLRVEARHPDVLAVGAAHEGRPLPFSSRGGATTPGPDVLAPGLRVWGPLSRDAEARPGDAGGLRALSGTSQAAGLAAGYAARVWRAEPDLLAADVRLRLAEDACDARAESTAAGAGWLPAWPDSTAIAQPTRHCFT